MFATGKYLVTCSFQRIETACESKASKSAAVLVKSYIYGKQNILFLVFPFVLLGIVLRVQHK